MKLDNTPIGMEERLEIQRISISDADVIKGNNEISINLHNKSANANSSATTENKNGNANSVSILPNFSIWVCFCYLGETPIIEQQASALIKQSNEKSSLSLQPSTTVIAFPTELTPNVTGICKQYASSQPERGSQWQSTDFKSQRKRECAQGSRWAACDR